MCPRSSTNPTVRAPSTGGPSLSRGCFLGVRACSPDGSAMDGDGLHGENQKAGTCTGWKKNGVLLMSVDQLLPEVRHTELARLHGGKWTRRWELESTLPARGRWQNKIQSTSDVRNTHSPLSLNIFDSSNSLLSHNDGLNLRWMAWEENKQNANRGNISHVIQVETENGSSTWEHRGKR